MGRVSPSGTVMVVTVSAPLGVLSEIEGFCPYSRCVKPVAVKLPTVTVVSVAVAFKVSPPPLRVTVPVLVLPVAATPICALNRVGPAPVATTLKSPLGASDSRRSVFTLIGAAAVPMPPPLPCCVFKVTSVAVISDAGLCARMLPPLEVSVTLREIKF